MKIPDINDRIDLAINLKESWLAWLVHDISISVMNLFADESWLWLKVMNPDVLGFYDNQTQCLDVRLKSEEIDLNMLPQTVNRIPVIYSYSPN